MRFKRVLTIEIGTAGTSFAVLEHDERLIEWGRQAISANQSAFLTKLSKLVNRYRPDILVLEDPAFSRKGSITKGYLAKAEEWAVNHDLHVQTLSAEVLKQYVDDSGWGRTKYDITCAMATHFPELQSILPPKKKIWQSEPASTGIFIAIARALYVYD